MTAEYKFEKNNIRQLVKSLTTLENKTLARLKIDINHKYGKSDTPENLTNKLRKGTIRFSEIIEIFEVLGYEIFARKKS